MMRVQIFLTPQHESGYFHGPQEFCDLFNVFIRQSTPEPMAARIVRQRVILQVYLLLAAIGALCLAYPRAALLAALPLGFPVIICASITPETFKVAWVAVAADSIRAEGQH